MSKYRNIKTEVDGIMFDSKKESARYAELRMLEKAGEISGLSVQPKFLILPGVRWNGTLLRERFYIADFTYIENHREIVEDVKSPITRKNPVYTLKRQLFISIYGREYEFIET